jgi:hypothetical protein
VCAAQDFLLEHRFFSGVHWSGFHAGTGLLLCEDRRTAALCTSSWLYCSDHRSHHRFCWWRGVSKFVPCTLLNHTMRRCITSILRQAGGWKRWQRTCREGAARRVADDVSSLQLQHQHHSHCLAAGPSRLVDGGHPVNRDEGVSLHGVLSCDPAGTRLLPAAAAPAVAAGDRGGSGSGAASDMTHAIQAAMHEARVRACVG